MKGLIFALLVVLLVANVEGTKILGFTKEVYTGDMTHHERDTNGYDDARDACQSTFPNLSARVCTEKDLGIFAQDDDIALLNDSEGIRFIDFSFGTHFDAATGRAERLDNCKGFTSASPNSVSRCVPRIFGGPIMVSACPCSQKLNLVCCTDVN